jgi:hypothetical protein
MLSFVAGVTALAWTGPAVAGSQWPLYGDPTAAATGDFNGDGIDDVAIGVPSEDVSGNRDAGAVNVLYGTASGLTAAGNQVWHQNTSGVPGVVERGDRLGRALATGDIDGDGFDDLAIGVPYENVRSGEDLINPGTNWPNTGAVVVLYGGPAGLTASGSQLWHQDRPNMKGEADPLDYFGWALAIADFDGDGFGDLAVGVPGEDFAKGVVHVLYGKASGLSGRDDQIWRQGQGGVDDAEEPGDRFGSSLAAGNLGFSSSEDDLAIGVPGERVVDDSSSGVHGAVHVVYGQPGIGLQTNIVPDLFLHEDVPGVAGAAEAGDRFGWALAIADFGRAPQEDLAVGVPGESETHGRQGAVHVFQGGSFGIVPAQDGSQVWHEATPGVEGEPESGDELGRSLAAGDFNGFSQSDLAIGSPWEDTIGGVDAGAVHVIFGSPAGLLVEGGTSTPDRLFDSIALGFSSAPGNLFGWAIAAGQLGRPAGAGDVTGLDLVVTVPAADMLGVVDAGAAHVLYGAGAFGSQLWYQDAPGVEGTGSAGDRFGG